MTTSSGTRKKKSASGRTNTGRKGTSARTNTATARPRTQQEEKIRREILFLLSLTIGILLFLCNFGVIGPVGNMVSGFLFGIFGLLAYVVPVYIFLTVAFGISNRGNRTAIIKMSAAIILFILVGALLHLFQCNDTLQVYSAGDIYAIGRDTKRGGGVLFGTIAYLLYSLLDTIGAVLVIAVLAIVCVVIMTERSFVSGVKKGSRYVVSTAKDETKIHREKARKRKEELEIERQKRLQLQQEDVKEQENQKSREEAEKILRMDKKVSGVMLDTKLEKEPAQENIMHRNMHEITVHDLPSDITYQEKDTKPVEPEFDFHNIRIHSENQMDMEEVFPQSIPAEDDSSVLQQATSVLPPVEEEFPESFTERFEEAAPKAIKKRPVAKVVEISEKDKILKAAGQVNLVEKDRVSANKPYQFPPISYLKKTLPNQNGDGKQQLKETAMRLQQTLSTFGVKVTITDISQGPAVTRYELQPEQGVKVSKIVGLTDDIKLNLAATDIRMEAPIPGKAAIGIEVPNKENASVGLRDLLESKEYQEFPSKLAFAVGKDIAGKVVVADIAKMPHMLIAGATGSGKSVCINTLIMSLLYKASPEEVKLIMIDPKVVELSVYNGIPHLLIPVVTDPKKAAAALHWGVAEMTDRYQRFADFNVRDLKGYNAEIEKRAARGETDLPKKMAQIVIIVDELADLMMVAPGEVEESICRLAQLARAAGIHLIIATQRPSVDVITGLIKANMPSRVAFAVSSGVDSRTILDMNGAEKLLGKGDMLFYPQGYPKPARIQGAFVSDGEVSDVVDFLKNQCIGNVYNEDIEDKIKNIGTQSCTSSASGEEQKKDDYFVEAGKFIIEKDKASIGMLQRVFKIGFNRAARIMDQLADAGVVGEEEGTKPRKVLMSLEQFESYIEESL